MTATTIPAPIFGRPPDLELARLWTEAIQGEIHFSSSQDKRHGEFYTYAPEKEADGRKRVRVKYLLETDVEAKILGFLMELADRGASVKVTTAKIRSVRNLGGLLLLQREGE